ncbi:MAG: YihY family inner membrane protein [Luteitalea sp.]|nr:YihY family inner membrane protein [Luteitalea sp.]
MTGVAAWRGLLRFLDGNLALASSIAFYSLLSLFPCLLLLLSLLGTLTADDGDREAVLEFALQYLPRQFEFVKSQIDAFRQTRVSLGVTGSIFMTWAALGFFSAVTRAVNHAWGVEQQPNYLKHKLVSFLMLLAAGVLFLVGLFLLSARSIVGASWFTDVLEQLPGLDVLRSFLVGWATTVVLIVCVALIFYFVPNTNRVRFRDVWAGAILTGLLWRGALLGFSWYVRDLSRFSVVHGSLAAVVVFMWWIYLCSAILLYGLQFTVAWAHLRRFERGEIAR